jgi:hypothetical protein
VIDKSLVSEQGVDRCRSDWWANQNQ